MAGLAHPESKRRPDRQLVRIILVRHGRPAWDFQTPICGRDFGEWRRGEDHAPLDPGSRPSPALERLIESATCVFTSPLRRSRESAALLAAGVSPVVAPEFREADLPSGFRSGLRLRPELWGLLARTAWFCGWSTGVDNFRMVRERAANAAKLLQERAARGGVVVLVGHGMMNILIARELRAAGWRGPRMPSRRHWGFGVYECLPAQWIA